jgi:hypothetical protein
VLGFVCPKLHRRAAFGFGGAVVHAQHSARQPVFRPNPANMGAGQVYSLSWRGAVAGLVVAVCCSGVCDGANFETKCQLRLDLQRFDGCGH